MQVSQNECAVKHIKADCFTIIHNVFLLMIYLVLKIKLFRRNKKCMFFDPFIHELRPDLYIVYTPTDQLCKPEIPISLFFGILIIL